MVVDYEDAWAAGIFEGEGCISTGGPVQRTEKQYIRLTMQMNDEDTVRRFAAAVGCGAVRYRAAVPPRQENWRWSVSAVADVQRVLRLLWPGLGARRQSRARELAELWWPDGFVW